MKIAMFTNTYLPHVGGVAKSVTTLADECRGLGHEVKVIAPVFDGAEDSPDVLRIPAIQKFNGSDFSVRLPVPNLVRNFMEEFQPDVIHSHHPFLLGDSALREAWKLAVPMVFTHHTLYEQYTHYVPFDSAALKRAAIQLATEYCNLCTTIIAPSESVAKLLLERGVTQPIESIPTGIDTAWFADGDGPKFRETGGIPADATVLGHVGRLAREKNIGFLAEAVRLYLQRDPKAVFLLVGDGDAATDARTVLEEEMAAGRVFAVGSRTGQDLADAYAAMDLFVFASQSETQGLVLAEAMASGSPVVALDGPGVREILHDDENGLMLDGDAAPETFADAIARLLGDPDARQRYSANARETAAAYDRTPRAEQVIGCYENAINAFHAAMTENRAPWEIWVGSIEVEWDLFAVKMSAAAAAIALTPTKEVSLD